MQCYCSDAFKKMQQKSYYYSNKGPLHLTPRKSVHKVQFLGLHYLTTKSVQQSTQCTVYVAMEKEKGGRYDASIVAAAVGKSAWLV